MKVLFKLSIIFIITSLSANSYAFPELPFCPAGGPPGWMNHLNHKRDQNIWRHYLQNASPAYFRPNNGYTPAYLPNYNRPYNYSTPPYNYNRNYSQLRTAPSRNN